MFSFFRKSPPKPLSDEALLIGKVLQEASYHAHAFISIVPVVDQKVVMARISTPSQTLPVEIGRLSRLRFQRIKSVLEELVKKQKGNLIWRGKNVEGVCLVNAMGRRMELRLFFRHLDGIPTILICTLIQPA